jgi:hypothetical protein
MIAWRALVRQFPAALGGNEYHYVERLFGAAAAGATVMCVSMLNGGPETADEDQLHEPHEPTSADQL